MKRGEAARDLTGTLAPRCVDGPWASPRAGGPPRPPLSCRDEMPGASILSSAAARQTSGSLGAGKSQTLCVVTELLPRGCGATVVSQSRTTSKLLIQKSLRLRTAQSS
ncbi:unnamed protein product [Pleuronectes platessa]|uniref:Uncharacterized protein n=1 Tax=Pleuronectes platessa TaxID=8262 RepID=A0A9N7VHH7_PLEPL|nr:unnamed protein product [Pleuronectes platessa]